MSIDELIEQGLKNGEEEGFNLLFAEYSGPILTHLSRILKRQEDAEDLLHDVMLRVVKKINLFSHSRDRNGDSLKSWVFRIATNIAIDKIRKDKRRKAIIEKESNSRTYSNELEDSAINQENNESIEKLLHKLTVTQRTYMNLRVQEEMSYMEISKICGCSINSVKQGIFKARNILRIHMLATKEGL